MSKGEDLEKQKAERAPAEDEAEDGKAEPRDGTSAATEGSADVLSARRPTPQRGQHVEEPEERTSDAPAEPRSESDKSEESAKPSDKGDGGGASPNQLGYKRYVYAAYLAGAIVVAFLGSKVGNLVWYRLAQWKPNLGEPKDEILMPIAGVIGAAVAFYYYRKPQSRQYANEVAEELSKVTWPTKKEVTNSTTVVIFTTLFATVYFALMDRFWGFVTNLVYGT